jgi:hypothetical protein
MYMTATHQSAKYQDGGRGGYIFITDVDMPKEMEKILKGKPVCNHKVTYYLSFIDFYP